MQAISNFPVAVNPKPTNNQSGSNDANNGEVKFGDIISDAIAAKNNKPNQKDGSAGLTQQDDMSNQIHKPGDQANAETTQETTEEVMGDNQNVDIVVPLQANNSIIADLLLNVLQNGVAAQAVSDDTQNLLGKPVVAIEPSINNNMPAQPNTIVQQTEATTTPVVPLVASTLENTKQNQSLGQIPVETGKQSQQSDLNLGVKLAAQPTKLEAPVAQTSTQNQNQAQNSTAQNGDGLTKAQTMQTQGRAEVASQAQATAQEAPKAQTESTSSNNQTVEASNVPFAKLNPEQVNIKVGDGAEVNAKNLAPKVAEEIMIKLGDNIDEFQIKLYPKELGEISVKIAHEAGRILVTLSCANNEARSLLAANMDSIRTIVENNTGNQAVVVVDDEQNYLKQQQDDLDQQRQRQEQKQQEKSEHQVVDENEMINFVNQLRLGLINQTLVG